ncbi:translation elongation factor EF-4 [Flavobacterium sp. 28A]|uniref:hypothetical protein n=1 Tax=Flavobacterium sp. 28A TaxID=2735895 RepID=UPI001570E119|nr:hypothetical protein [Flavobacterium sp. 28A]NRT15283.1 translation elongation factor EF-4 [Flavobacterium sp. 28A]
MKEDLFGETIEEKIDKIIRDYWIIIDDYTITQDCSIDVKGNVIFPPHLHYIKEIPLVFNEVNGNFNCRGQSLITLRNSPRIVRGDFDCSLNQLIDLQYCPDIVNGIFSFDDNLQSLNNGYKSVDFNSVYVSTTFLGDKLPTIVTENKELLNTVLKYHNYYDVYDSCGVFNDENYKGLIDDIKNGLV